MGNRASTARDAAPGSEDSAGAGAAQPEATTEALGPRASEPAPPADGRCLLDELPNALVVTICSYLTYEWRALEKQARLCRSFRERLSDDFVWQHLCTDYWFVEEEHFSQWPKIKSWRALYRTLEQWAVLEGYYTLPAAFPWCLLVLLRFEKGSLVAEAVRFCEQSGPSDEDRVRELCVRLFEVSFSEEEDGVHASLTFPSDCKGLLNGHSASVTPLPDAVLGVLPIARRYFRQVDRIVPQWLHATRGLAVALDSSGSGSATTSDQSDDDDRFGLWSESLSAWQHAQSGEALQEITAQMVYQLLSASGSLPLSLVRSPVEYILDDPNAPHLRPGLYVGNYGHTFYGQYKHEVILVEFRECAADNIESLFARPAEVGGGLVPRVLRQALQEAGGERCSFLVGTKVTGDFHVPAGQTTFVALVSPAPAMQRLDRERGIDGLHEVRNRTTGAMEQIHCSWPGFGTLAMPGFGRPSWEPGWLVRLEPAPGDPARADRFGFMWDRNQDTVVLQYVRAQTNAPFLSRKWLPEGLR